MPGVCARCHREVYFAEERLALEKVWHTFCFSCCISSTEGNHKNPINNLSTPRPCPRLSVRRVSFCEKKNIIDRRRDMQNDCRVFLEDRNFDDNSNVDILTIRSSEDVSKLDQDLNDEDLNYTDRVNSTQISCNDNTLIRKYNDNNINKDMTNCIHRNFHDSLNNIDDKNEDDEDDRMRGGHGGGNGCRKSKKLEDCCAGKTISEECGCFSCQNVENKGCGYRKRCLEFEPCPPREYDPCLENHKSSSCKSASCSPPCTDRRSCPPAGCRPVCRKARRSCCSPCKGESPSCGGGGCCGNGCRGGCGKPGQTCIPSRPCSTPPCRSFPPCVETTCISPRPSCIPTPPCCRPPSGGGCCVGGGSGGGGGASYCRSRSSPCRTIQSGSCCYDNVTCCDIDRADSCCKAKLPPGCECLGGGLDCQRCGRKVYQAEMQVIASGVPYHNICFSCFCCRKPLEPLTYQENCGEIYCKQCYIRNFGPQGYGYGMGAGALQTPM
ncbi:hypothetical protein M0802_003945 [Mischocyttarus mexicanus]|nr:hypothetical protein M0802_003945 [Mischocyttarus mexicanus]